MSVQDGWRGAVRPPAPPADLDRLSTSTSTHSTRETYCQADRTGASLIRAKVESWVMGRQRVSRQRSDQVVAGLLNDCSSIP